MGTLKTASGVGGMTELHTPAGRTYGAVAYQYDATTFEARSAEIAAGRGFEIPAGETSYSAAPDDVWDESQLLAVYPE